jgi:toxin ParE1/3/4
MKQALLSDRARTDLEEIWAFIAMDSPAAADRFIDRLLRSCRNLATLPRLGRAREDLAPGLRSLPVGDYLVFYRKARSGIEVARVLSGYRDLEDLFGL